MLLQSIADRLRKKNEELIASASNDRPLTERSSGTDSYTNKTSGDRSSTSSSISSIRTSGTKTTPSVSLFHEMDLSRIDFLHLIKHRSRNNIVFKVNHTISTILFEGILICF